MLAPASIHIALLDDHTLFRQGLRHILEPLSYVGRVSESSTFAELLEICRQQPPDLLLLDLQMPKMDGTQVAQALLSEFPTLKIIVVSMFTADNYVAQMMRLGARSYLSKDSSAEQLIEAIEAVLHTGNYFTDHISLALVKGVQQPTQQYVADLPGEPQLTRRELEVLQLICRGHKAAEIAEQLFISRRTVEGHWQKLLNKTEAGNAAGLVAYAAKHGLFESDR